MDQVKAIAYEMKKALLASDLIALARCCTSGGCKKTNGRGHHHAAH